MGINRRSNTLIGLALASISLPSIVPPPPVGALTPKVRKTDRWGWPYPEKPPGPKTHAKLFKPRKRRRT